MKRNGDSAEGFVLAHPALVGSFGLFLLVAVRLHVVAGFDTDTALGILRHTGPTEVALGVLVGSYPFAILACAAAVVFMTLNARSYGLLALEGVFIMGLIYVVPWRAIVLAAGAILVVVVLGLVARRRQKREGKNGPLIEPSTVGVWIVLLALIGPGYWGQPEVVVVGSPQQIGYVLNEELKWTAFLSHPRKEIQLIETATISRRIACRLEQGYGQPLVTLRNNSERTNPPCEETPPSPPPAGP